MSQSLVNVQPAMKKTLVIEGGALRSVFSAGLLDGFLARGFDPFDEYIGVSGGACNLLAFLAGLPGGSLNTYQAVARHPAFLSVRRFLLGGDLIDIGWLADYLFEQYGSALTALCQRQTPLYIVTTDVQSGEARLVRAAADTLRETLTASMSLPLLHRRFPLCAGLPATDGGVAANIPIRQALERGATRVMVVRSRPRAFIKRDTLGHRLLRYKLRAHPQLVSTMRQRVNRHQAAVALLDSPPAGISVIDICPPDHFTAGRFTRNASALEQGYRAGLAAADGAIQQWQQSPTMLPSG